MTDPIHVAVATNERYLPWCATLLHSCLAHDPRGLHIHVLKDHDVSRQAVEPLEAMVRGSGAEISVPDVDMDLVAALPTTQRFGGRTAFLRLLLPELVPDLARVLYLDVDTLVMTSLRPLWDVDLAGVPIGAISNVVDPSMHESMRAVGVDPTSTFNSGVLLIDLEQVRAERAFREVISDIAQMGASPWPDQDALNRAFAGRWHALHPRWNAMNSLWTWPVWARQVFGQEQWREAKKHPAILHFEGPSICKPWHYLCTHPLRDVYRRTTTQTPWGDVPLEDRTLATRLLAQLPSRWRIPMYWRLHRARTRSSRNR